jgi:hypothetical protein
MAKDSDISLKGLDNFSKQFLLSGNDGSKKGETEYITVGEGQRISAEALKHYDEARAKSFMQRAGSFTEDLIAFIVEQKNMRDLDDVATIFGLALANINLRNAYGKPRGAKEKTTPEEQEARWAEFDAVCMGAQEYYDANT